LLSFPFPCLRVVVAAVVNVVIVIVFVIVVAAYANHNSRQGENQLKTHSSRHLSHMDVDSFAFQL